MTLMPEFREQLTTAAARRQHGRRPWRHGISAAPALVVGLVALAIAAGAVLALGHGAGTGAPSDGTGATATTPPPALTQARRQLTAELGVLRAGRPDTSPTIIPLLLRPLTHAPKGAYRPDHTALDLPLVRAVRLGSYRVGILPTRWSVPGRLYRSEGLVASFYGPGVDQLPARLQRRDPVPQLSSATPPATPASVARHGLIVTSEVAPGVDRGAIVVPDHVAAVMITAVRITPTMDTAAVTVPITPVTESVHDNVAALTVRGLTLQQLGLSRTGLAGRYYMARPATSRSCRFTFAIYGVPAQARITWLDGSGATTRSVTAHLTLYVTTDRPVTPRRASHACEAAKRARR